MFRFCPSFFVAERRMSLARPFKAGRKIAKFMSATAKKNATPSPALKGRASFKPPLRVKD